MKSLSALLTLAALAATSALAQMSQPMVSENTTRISDHVWANMGFPNIAKWITTSSLVCGDGHDEDTRTRTHAGANKSTLRCVVVVTGPSSVKSAMTRGGQAKFGCATPVAHPSSDSLKSKGTRTPTTLPMLRPVKLLDMIV
jgi:hypothetical protein